MFYRAGCEIRPVSLSLPWKTEEIIFSSEPAPLRNVAGFFVPSGFGRFRAIWDTFGRKWYNLSSGRKYGLKTKIRPK